MCLAVPAKIVELEGDRAVVDLHGNRVEISTLLTPQAEVGDWVLLHAGFAIQILDAEAAMETYSQLAEFLGSDDGPRVPPPRGRGEPTRLDAPTPTG